MGTKIHDLSKLTQIASYVYLIFCEIFLDFMGSERNGLLELGIGDGYYAAQAV